MGQAFRWRAFVGAPPVDVVPFRAFDRIALVLGFILMGGAAGMALTLAVGPQSPFEVAKYAAPVLIVALYLGYAEYRAILERGAWIGIACAVLLIVGTIAWPLGILFAPELTRTMLIPVVSTMLFACVTLAAGEAHEVYRSANIALLVAALAVNQQLLSFMGR